VSVASLFGCRPVLLAACALMMCAPPGSADETHASGPAAALAASAAESVAADVADADLFPSQTYESLALAAPAAAEVPPPPMQAVASAPEMAPPPEEPLPFATVAIWKDGTRETYAVEGLGKTFLFCAQCRVPGAVHPGETIADGYRLKALDDAQATLVAPDGQERPMPLIGMAH
jgi:hypothetical protein